MQTLFEEMKQFAPTANVIVDIDIEKRVDFISVDLLVAEGEETVYYPHRVNHKQFEGWLNDNGYFDRETVHNWSDTITGEHRQRVEKAEIDYMIYLDVYLCAQDVFDYLKAMGKTKLKYQPE